MRGMSRARGMAFGLVMVVLLALSGCTAKTTLYVVDGPLAAQKPAPVYPGTMTVHASLHAATVSIVMDGGEKFRGNLELSRAPQVGTRAGDGGSRFASMEDAWDQIYGKGYYVAHVLGDGQFGHLQMTGSNGTVVEFELHSAVSGTGDQTVMSQPLGVAKDSKGNLYKVVVG